MYQIPQLKKFPNLVHGFSTRSEGDMSLRFGQKEKVIKNRKKFLKKLNISLSDCVVMKASHSTRIITVNFPDNLVVADGLMTDKKSLYLFLLIADCLPIILYDPKKEILGLVHAGWRNTNNRIV